MMKTFSQQGAAILIFVLFFAFSAGAIIFSLNQSIYSDLRDFNQLSRGKQAFYTSESLLEDMVYRQVFDSFSLNSSETFSLGGASASATTTYVSADDEYITQSVGLFGTVQRKTEGVITITSGTSFFYGMQTGTGGVEIENTAKVIGNLYSNGSVTGKNTPEVQGDVVSAGSAGLVKDLPVTGTVRSNTINRNTIGGNAYYNVQVGTNAQNPVAGTRYTPATNMPTASFPIASTTVQGWKDEINSSGSVISASDPLCSSGTYTITTSISIGDVRIDCNVDIRSTAVVTLTGPIWVQGNLNFTNTVTVQAHSSLGRKSVPIIVDKSSNRTTSSKIDLKNSVTFNGSGDPRSYILLLSMNESSSLGGSEVAISLQNTVNGDLLVYADKGMVDIQNSIVLKEVTAHKVKIRNSAQVIYETGLEDLVFDAGPGGAYSVVGWRQVP